MNLWGILARLAKALAKRKNTMKKSFIAVIILTFGCLILFTKSSFAIYLPVNTELKYEVVENQGSSGPIS